MEVLKLHPPTGPDTTTLIWVSVDKLILPVNDKPISFKRLRSIVRSIENGEVINSPLVRRIENEYFTIVDGRHRYLARRIVGAKWVRCEVEPGEST